MQVRILAEISESLGFHQLNMAIKKALVESTQYEADQAHLRLLRGDDEEEEAEGGEGGQGAGAGKGEEGGAAAEGEGGGSGAAAATTDGKSGGGSGGKARKIGPKQQAAMNSLNKHINMLQVRGRRQRRGRGVEGESKRGGGGGKARKVGPKQQAAMNSLNKHINMLQVREGWGGGKRPTRGLRGEMRVWARHDRLVQSSRRRSVSLTSTSTCCR